MPQFHRPLDQLLDVNVRDGLVYYRALRGERGRLDRYVASLNVPAATYQAWPREDKIAFWLNGYNAIVLQTVISHYPIKGKSSQYPASSIRQIPGVFETAKHRLAGRSLTLDEIEKTVLPEFDDPRLYLALGRGAVGSGRLRSEAYVGSRLASQLASVQSEFVSDQAMLKIDRADRQDVGHADHQLARGGVRDGLRQGRAGTVCAAVADRAGGARVRHAPPAPARTRVRREERLPDVVSTSSTGG